MAAATTVSAISFAVATAVFVAIDAESLLQLTNPWFWLLAGATLFGSVAGNLRGVALATCVTLLVPADRRDRANGRVGTVNGMAFAITSVFSGLVIGYLGMGWALYGTLTLTVAALVHLQGIHIDEPEPDPASPSASSVDIKGALDAIRGVPGLSLLIFLAAFNNLLGGVFLALIDPYGLSLVSVQAWGFLWGFISLAMILGGLAVAKFGLGPRPLRVLLGGNLIAWTVCAAFTLQSSIVLLGAGMVIWMFLMPSIEASEQTVLQRLIPYERQGRVFGFAQLVENAASPITAFLMAPLAEAVFMPLMTDGAGADAIGSWFGTGEERGLALLFTIAGILGVMNTLLVWRSRSYHRLRPAGRPRSMPMTPNPRPRRSRTGPKPPRVRWSDATRRGFDQWAAATTSAMSLAVRSAWASQSSRGALGRGVGHHLHQLHGHVGGLARPRHGVALHVDEVGAAGQRGPSGAVGHEGVAGGQHRRGRRVQHDLARELLADQGAEGGVVDVVLDHAADPVHALPAVVEGAGGADVEDPRRAALGDGTAHRDGGTDLADAGEHDVDAPQVGGLLADGHHHEQFSHGSHA